MLRRIEQPITRKDIYIIRIKEESVKVINQCGTIFREAQSYYRSNFDEDKFMSPPTYHLKYKIQHTAVWDSFYRFF